MPWLPIDSNSELDAAFHFAEGVVESAVSSKGRFVNDDNTVLFHSSTPAKNMPSRKYRSDAAK